MSRKPCSFFFLCLVAAAPPITGIHPAVADERKVLAVCENGIVVEIDYERNVITYPQEGIRLSAEITETAIKWRSTFS